MSAEEEQAEGRNQKHTQTNRKLDGPVRKSQLRLWSAERAVVTPFAQSGQGSFTPFLWAAETSQRRRKRVSAGSCGPLEEDGGSLDPPLSGAALTLQRFLTPEGG